MSIIDTNYEMQEEDALVVSVATEPAGYRSRIAGRELRVKCMNLLRKVARGSDGRCRATEQWHPKSGLAEFSVVNLGELGGLMSHWSMFEIVHENFES